MASYLSNKMIFGFSAACVYRHEFDSAQVQ